MASDNTPKYAPLPFSKVETSCIDGNRIYWGVERIVIMADLNRFSNRFIFVYKNTIVIHLLSDNIVISWVYQEKVLCCLKIICDDSSGY